MAGHRQYVAKGATNVTRDRGCVDALFVVLVVHYTESLFLCKTEKAILFYKLRESSGTRLEKNVWHLGKAAFL